MGLLRTVEPGSLEKTIQLKNIRSQQRLILQEISHRSRDSTLNAQQSQKILKTLAQNVTRIEQLCAQQQVIPTNLAGPSRQIYGWMKFLLNERNLQLHLQATRRVRQLALEILSHTKTFSPGKRPALKDPENIEVEFTNMVGLYKSRSNQDRTLIQISEGFIVASNDIFAAVAQAALLGKRPATTEVIKLFSLSEEFSELLLELDLITEAIAETARGKFYDLEAVFDTVNHQYFAGRLAKPRLIWNRVLTVRKFAHYEPARDRIVVSLSLDNSHIPKDVIEFVMYHELLHKQHGGKWINGRLFVHTPEFRQDERKFKHYQQVQQWLGKLVLD
jgi:hypothetical protein